MAKATDLPKEHRGLAGRIKYLDSMPAEEARHRAKHVNKLESEAPLTGDARALMLAHSSRLLASLPAGEYLEQVKKYNDLADSMPGNSVDSPAYDMRQAAIQLKASNVFPPGLIEACERRLLGKEPTYDDCDIDAVLGLGQTEKAKADALKRKARPGEGYCTFCGDPVKAEDYVKGSEHWGGKCINAGGKTEIAKSVNRALAGLREREQALRDEIRSFKKSVAGDHARAGRPVPRNLGLPISDHPDAPRWRELEAEAERLRDQASGIDEADIAETYLAKARERENKAAQLRRAAGES